jgi:AraC family transcriptional regulator of adaptative response/methylated-DNA-[protein]-cysteine methyltransferase
VALGDADTVLERELTAEFPKASIRRDDRELGPLARMVVRELSGDAVAAEIPVDIKATAFQRRVWKALRRIPRGATRTYTEVAAGIGQPGASRAVARACAANPLALVVPCHRVVPAAGGTGGYRWGRDRKARLLELEAVKGRKA